MLTDIPSVISVSKKQGQCFWLSATKAFPSWPLSFNRVLFAFSLFQNHLTMTKSSSLLISPSLFRAPIELQSFMKDMPFWNFFRYGKILILSPILLGCMVVCWSSFYLFTSSTIISMEIMNAYIIWQDWLICFLFFNILLLKYWIDCFFIM